LIDARHGLKEADDAVLATLDKAAVNYQVVLTKADQISGEALADMMATTQATLAQHAAAHPDLLATSVRSDAGIAELRAAIARLLGERS
jgi:GTP-binding protein